MKSFQSQQFFPIAVICISLCFAATVQAREQDPTMPEDPLPFVEGSFTLVALPDTQGYSEDFPASFDAQTEWIVANAKSRNIAFVVHLGDITDDNQPEQWAVAQHALQKLDGVVPYSLCLGNHDLGEKGQTATRDSLLREYFPLDKYKTLPGFGGVFDQEADRLDNSYHLFSAGGRNFIVLALEFAPRDAVVEWANRVLGQYPDRWAILTTHGYLYSDDTRYDWAAKGSKQMWNPHAYKAAKEPGQGNDGEELWQKLVSKHPKMLMVINGHVLNDGLGRLTSQGDAGNPVHQMLVNFQMKQHLGDGFLRLIEFLPDGETVQVKDYSSVVNAYKSGEDNHFVLKIPRVK
jgi:hypothetical protein